MLQYTIKSVLNIKSTSPSLYILMFFEERSPKKREYKDRSHYIVARIVFCYTSRKKNRVHNIYWTTIMFHANKVDPAVVTIRRLICTYIIDICIINVFSFKL